MLIVYNGPLPAFSSFYERTNYNFKRGTPQEVPDALGERLLRVNAAFSTVGVAGPPGNTEGHGAKVAPPAESAGAAEGAEAVGSQAPDAAPVRPRRRRGQGKA